LFRNSGKRTLRRDFLRVAAFAGLSLAGGRSFSPLFKSQNDDLFLRNIGVCTSLSNNGVLAASGCTYIEEGVRGFLVPEEEEEKYAAKLSELKASKLPVRACNGFLPGQLKAVGPEPKHEAILAYAGTALRRAARAGVEIIVWGSGESRKIPDGFSRDRAEEQFAGLAKKVAALAAPFGVILTLEPLNSGETNFLNNLKEGAAMVEAVGHPNFKLLADIYHLLREGETPDDIEMFGKHLRHCHIAEKEKRTWPGAAGDDFRPFFKALKKIGYRGRLSMECRWENMTAELPAAMACLKKQIAEIT
jgi:sugar phosphate isomerase/epimerase